MPATDVEQEHHQKQPPAAQPQGAPADPRAAAERFVPLITAVLTLVTLVLYWRVRGFEFIHEYDDDLYVAGNEVVKLGFTWRGVGWAFTTGHASNWHPLTWLSHMLDVTLFGARPGPHHLVSALLHLANTVMWFYVLRRMTGSVWRSAAVAALFAWHPMHVESVAWVAERKDVLSTLLMTLTFWAYVVYAERPSGWRYAVVALVFAAGLMAKPMLVTLPMVLLLLDYWPLRRLWSHGAEPPGARRATLWHLFLEKVPLLALSALSSAITFAAQQRGGAVVTLQQIALPARVANAVVAYAQYLRKAVWPGDLAVFYPHRDWSAGTVAASAGVLLLVTAAVIVLAWRRPRLGYLPVGWLMFLGMLVPVIGLVQVGGQAMADRYSYVPYIGLFVMLAWGLGDGVAAVARVAGGRAAADVARAAAAAVVLASLIACSAKTWAQVGVWRDGQTLFGHALAVTRDNFVAHNNLGNSLAKVGRYDQAVPHYKRALAIRPDFAGTHYNLGTALLQLGDIDGAIARYREALKQQPNYIDANYNLAVALERKGAPPEEPERHYREAIKHSRAFPEAHHSLGNLLIKSGRHDEGVAELRKAVEMKPNFARAQADLGLALARSGDPAGAGHAFAAWARTEPNNASAFYNLGNALLNGGDAERAVQAFSRVLALTPKDAEAHRKLALCFTRLGQPMRAVEAYRQAVRLRPDWVPVLVELAWMLATNYDPLVRNGKEAVELAERAEKLGGGDAAQEVQTAGTLAAAYAEAGRFADAIKAAERARDLARAANRNDLAAAAEACLAAYRERRPYRQ